MNLINKDFQKSAYQHDKLKEMKESSNCLKTILGNKSSSSTDLAS